MDEKILKAIELLAGKITNQVTADDALKFTQAALNLANAGATLEHGKKISVSR